VYEIAQHLEVKCLKVTLDKYPLTEFLRRKKKLRSPKVFVLEARPEFPVKGMGASLFRLDMLDLQERMGISAADAIGVLVTEGKRIDCIGISKLDTTKGVKLDCSVFADGSVRIICNDDNYAEEFFNILVFEKMIIEWTISKNWTNDPFDVSVFMGGLLGISATINPLDKASKEVAESFKEATKSFEAQNWKATVVMSRRTIEAVLKDAYKGFFKKNPIDRKGRSLDLNGLIVKFEKTSFLPKHWLKILDSIRLIGNVPGAHPVAIPKYKFTLDDALLALQNTGAFLKAYYSQIV
jgi:hypothetical protein